MSGIKRFNHGVCEYPGGIFSEMNQETDGDYVIYSDHEAEGARLRAEASGLSESLTDALECEKDYLLEISELRAEVEENEKAMNVWRRRLQARAGRGPGSVPRPDRVRCTGRHQPARN